ncbi:hypothetical protein PTTG_28738 [Puccinia triticina 1-1 BBBD Race 1]|uniref:Uncharacterized protein n=2 Tax=Puccinia triticina TaxID=208348 RepID=A0A0C4EKI0_PUCT1|nr:uncharacterized protein PtA15_13A115 [Puccinia triticina]OAV89286.1 hypothetical protein PTTG_28738 [Puccinia triticina 1-1 BBBD Race 1]WAQ90716.1 hypothetical protein PtA15_13A115 [Puccinia triticina]WAR60904.1 hypothetical protein PtB15_13B153 [Puccinia triticina]
MTHQADQHKTEQAPKNDFHTLPVEDKKSGTTPAVLVGTPGLNNDGVVTTQAGPVIPGEQLAGVPIKSSEDLDQRADALNKPKPN